MKGEVWYNKIMRIMTKYKEQPAMSPLDSITVVDVNRIEQAIEKARRVLFTVQMSGNVEAQATWERILASLHHKWLDATIEVQTKGRYSFQ
jgi:hypothetical protein